MFFYLWKVHFPGGPLSHLLNDRSGVFRVWPTTSDDPSAWIDVSLHHSVLVRPYFYHRQHSVTLKLELAKQIVAGR